MFLDWTLLTFFSYENVSEQTMLHDKLKVCMLVNSLAFLVNFVDICIHLW